MAGNGQKKWIDDTLTMFDELSTENKLLGEDIQRLRDRVTAGYVIDPPGPNPEPPDPVDPPEPAYTPPVVDIKAKAATVKEG
jgi:hypothetical protein